MTPGDLGPADAGDEATARLQNRILGFSLAGILVTGLATAFATALPAFHAGTKKLEAATEFHVRVQTLAVGQFATRLGDMVLQVTSRSIIRSRLEAHLRGEIDAAELRAFSEPKLFDAISQNSEAIGIVRAGPDGTPLVEVGRVLPRDYWPVPDVGASSPSIGMPVRFQDNGYLLAAAHIYSAEGKHLGTDVVTFRDDALNGMLATLQHGPDARVFLTVHQNAFALEQGGLRRIELPPGLTTAVKRADAGDTGALKTDDQLLFYAPAARGWSVVVSMPSRSLYANAVGELMAPALVVLVMLALAAFGTSRSIRPLAERSVKLNSQLRTTAEEQRALLEYARGFVYRSAGAGPADYISPSVEEVLGYTPAELPSDIQYQLTAGVAGVLPAEGELPACLLTVMHKNGVSVVLEVNARVHRIDGRNGVFGVARDVTQRVAAEEALRASEERLRTLINASPDFICFKDGKGRWLEVNRAGLDLLGITNTGFRGRTNREVADDMPAPVASMLLRFADLDEQAWQAGVPQRAEEGIGLGDGSERVLDLIRVPLFDSQGERTGLLVLGRDTTERRRAERALARSAAEWTYATDFLDDAIYLVDLDDKILRANRAFLRFTGLTVEQVIGRSITEIMHPNGEKVPCRVCQARSARKDAFITMEPDHPDNPHGRPMEIMVKMIPDVDGAPSRILMGIHDLSRTRRTEEELRLAATVFEGSHEGIVITDAARRVLRANSAFTRITGFAADEAAGRTVQDVLCAHSGKEMHHAEIWAAVETDGVWQGEAWYRRRTGEVFPAWHRISALRNARGDVLHYINLFSDISEKKHSEERIHHLAHYDALTELPNRLLFNDRLGHSIERAVRHDGKVALLFIDLDRFKQVNDTLGHQVGDLLLQTVAHRLREAVREQDTVARLGGDEFTVVLEDLVRLDDAVTVAKKIIDSVSQPVMLQGHEVVVGASIGISVYPEDGRDAPTLLRNADAAMYRAKQLGRNNYQCYAAEFTRVSRERLDLEIGLRHALERRELILQYQPQVVLASGHIAGAEALLRWDHPKNGLMLPGAFIPLAEEAGLMDVFGAWVLETACAQLREWQAQGVPLRRMAVNLSAAQLDRGDLVETIRGIVERTGIDAADLELEFKEKLVTPLGDRVQILHDLRDLGVTIAIDNFGAGYSSPALLKRLPIDRLKIDRAFVREIPADRDHMAIAATVIAMAHHLDLQVIAEGVEQQDQVDFLRRHHCDEVQGYFYSEPVSADAFVQLARKRSVY